MCPSFMATRNEKDTTRARANILREFLTNSTKANRFDHKEIYEVMDLCLSCKGCKSECPSNVDVAKLKAEFMQHYYDANGVPFRSKLIANFTNSSKLGAIAPSIYNFVMTNSAVSSLVKKVSGFATKRSMPTMYKTTLRKWFKAEGQKRLREEGGRQKEEEHSNKDVSSLHPKPSTVYLFCDEFTNYNDTTIGIKAVQLLNKLGYEVIIPEHIDSGRSWLSKGLIRKGKEIANKNIELLHPIISAETPLIGIEPSAILTFRDEYIDLATDENFDKAKQLAANVLMIDEFIHINQ